MAQISLKYLALYFFHNIDIAFYTIALWQYGHGLEMSLIDRQWRWFVTLGVIGLTIRIITFAVKYTSQQIEIEKNRLSNEKAEEELRALKLENDRKEIENENLKKA